MNFVPKFKKGKQIIFRIINYKQLTLMILSKH